METFPTDGNQGGKALTKATWGASRQFFFYRDRSALLTTGWSMVWGIYQQHCSTLPINPLIFQCFYFGQLELLSLESRNFVVSLQVHVLPFKRVGNPSSVIERPWMATQFVKRCPLNTAQIAGGLVVVCFDIFFLPQHFVGTLSPSTAKTLGSLTTQRQMFLHTQNIFWNMFANMLKPSFQASSAQLQCSALCKPQTEVSQVKVKVEVSQWRYFAISGPCYCRRFGCSKPHVPVLPNSTEATS